VLEVNPRASRTVPFVSKATGVPWAKVAARVMAGRTLAELGVKDTPSKLGHVAVKEAVFPFVKFPSVDTVLGPEMKSTGEVMGIDRDFPAAFAKAQIAAGTRLPTKGAVLLSVRDADKAHAVEVAKELVALGFSILATAGTARCLAAAGVPARQVAKVKEGRPHCVDAIINREVAMVVNTTSIETGTIRDSFSLRRSALNADLPYFTTIQAARAAAQAIAEMLHGGGHGEGDAPRGLDVRPLQSYHR
jgi:carbamoyl-phosphate synthase large subunit